MRCPGKHFLTHLLVKFLFETFSITKIELFRLSHWAKNPPDQIRAAEDEKRKAVIEARGVTPYLPLPEIKKRAATPPQQGAQ